MPEPKLRRWVDRFLTHLRVSRNYSPQTLRAYESDLAHFAAAFPELEPAQVQRVQVRAYLADLQGVSGLQRSSLLRRVSALRSFLRFLRQEAVIAHDPFAAVPLPKRQKKLPRFLTEAEMKDLLAGAGKGLPCPERDRAILELLYSSGLRRSELSGLNVGDVDFFTGLARVFGKGSKERMVPVGDVALGCLRAYLATRRSDASRGDRPLFANARGGRLSGAGVAFVLKTWIRSAGWHKAVTPHMFRHSFATHLLNSGCDLRSVQELLGHKKLETTQVYTHLSLEKIQSVYRKAHPRSAGSGESP